MRENLPVLLKTVYTSIIKRGYEGPKSFHIWLTKKRFSRVAFSPLT